MNAYFETEGQQIFLKSVFIARLNVTKLGSMHVKLNLYKLYCTIQEASK